MYRRKILPAEWTCSAQRGRRVGRVCLTSHSAVEKRLFGPRFFAQAKKSSSTAEWLVKVCSRAEGGRKPLTLTLIAVLLLLLQLLLLELELEREQEQEQRLSLPFGERVTFLCLCKEKITKRKAPQQPNGWSSTPCLRAHAATRRGSTPPPGFFDDTSLYRRKTTCVLHVAPFGVLSAGCVAAEGARKSKALEQRQRQLQRQLQRPKPKQLPPSHTLPYALRKGGQMQRQLQQLPMRPLHLSAGP